MLSKLFNRVGNFGFSPNSFAQRKKFEVIHNWLIADIYEFVLGDSITKTEWTTVPITVCYDGIWMKNDKYESKVWALELIEYKCIDLSEVHLTNSTAPVQTVSGATRRPDEAWCRLVDFHYGWVLTETDTFSFEPRITLLFMAFAGNYSYNVDSISVMSKSLVRFPSMQTTSPGFVWLLCGPTKYPF